MSNISSDFPTRQPAPKIGENGTWLEWDELTQAYVDTGRPSRGDSAGLSGDIKDALLTLAQKVTYVDEHGQDYYDALYAALYPPAELLSITASFAQGSHTVYDTDTLDSLKPYLTVTGAYDDGSSRAITDYTLSGTLTEGTSTITVTAGGKTTTLTVSVTHKVAQVTGISAVFSQGSAVIYDNASLDDLKPYLVVTASYDDGTSAAVSGYTLSGTLAAGTSTITASYSGFSDTFTVTVTERPVTLVSISAMFTQGQNVVYDTDSLDTLKQYLVVTAHYDDNTDTVVSGYTLSGTLAVGTSTITVSFGGKTTTFTVTVTHKAETVTVYFSTLERVGTVIKKDGTATTLSSGYHFELPYIDGMFVSTLHRKNWVANYPPFVVYDNGEYSVPEYTDVSAVGTCEHYTTTISGYSANAIVYANWVGAGKNPEPENDYCYYSYLE